MQSTAMRILANAPDPQGLIYSAIVAAVVVIAGFFAGAFRPRKTPLPPRIDPSEPPEIIWMIILLAFATSCIVPVTLSALALGVTRWSAPIPAAAPATTLSTTAPSTAATTKAATSSPAAATPGDLQLPPTLTVGILLASNLFLGYVLVGVNLSFRPGGLRRMGFAISMLPSAIVPSILAALIVLPLTFFVTQVTEWLLDLLGMEHPTEHMLLRIFGAKDALLLHVLIIVSAVIIAPVVEEFLYRGHLQTALRALLGRAFAGTSQEPLKPRVDRAHRWLAIFVTSIVFALAHLEPWMMLPIFFLSLCLGYVYERTGNLWFSILLHLIFNAANVTLFVLQRPA
jgi:membrane protease YdiL (CAAX protease family)